MRSIWLKPLTKSAFTRIANDFRDGDPAVDSGFQSQEPLMQINAPALLACAFIAGEEPELARTVFRPACATE